MQNIFVAYCSNNSYRILPSDSLFLSKADCKIRNFCMRCWWGMNDGSKEKLVSFCQNFTIICSVSSNNRSWSLELSTLGFSRH